MKRTLSLFLAALIGITSLFASAWATDEDQPLISPNPDSAMAAQRIDGTVKEVNKTDDGLTILVQDPDDENHSVLLNITDETRVMDNSTGLPANVEDIKVDDKISAYHSAVMTRSLPPMSNAEVILVNIKDGETLGTYLEVYSVEKNEDGSIRVLNDNGDLYLTLTEETPLTAFGTKNIVTLADIQPGSKLVAYFDIVALSMPGQATALKAVVFPYDYAGSITVKADGAIEVNGEALTLLDTEAPYTVGDSRMVPLRKIAEALDYTVVWDNATQGISLKTNAEVVLPASLTIGSNVCTLEDGTVEFSAPAILKNNHTFVPADFFKFLGTLKIVIE